MPNWGSISNQKKLLETLSQASRFRTSARNRARNSGFVPCSRALELRVRWGCCPRDVGIKLSMPKCDLGQNRWTPDPGSNKPIARKKGMSTDVDLPWIGGGGWTHPTNAIPMRSWHCQDMFLLSGFRVDGTDAMMSFRWGFI